MFRELKFRRVTTRIGLAGLLSAIMVAAIVVPASAAPVSTANVSAVYPQTTCSVQATTSTYGLVGFARSATELSSAEAAHYAQEVNLPSSSQSGLTIITSSPRAWRLGDGSIFVAYPLAGSNAWLSSVGAMIGTDGEVAQEAELAFEGNRFGGTMRLWIDGELVAEKTHQDGGITPQFSWNEFTRCMERAGIPAWVSGAITVGCAVVCAATVGAGCIACALGLAGIYGAQVGYCLDQAA